MVLLEEAADDGSDINNNVLTLTTRNEHDRIGRQRVMFGSRSALAHTLRSAAVKRRPQRHTVMTPAHADPPAGRPDPAPAWTPRPLGPGGRVRRRTGRWRRRPHLGSVAYASDTTRRGRWRRRQRGEPVVGVADPAAGGGAGQANRLQAVGTEATGVAASAEDAPPAGKRWQPSRSRCMPTSSPRLARCLATPVS
jgi:hypothetical protein